MSDETQDQTPERLRAFRKDRARAPRLGLWASMLAAFAAGALVCAVGFRFASPEPTPAPAAHGGLAPDRLRALAVHLERKNLPDRAIAVWTDYLAQAPLDDAERAGVCYSIARIAREHGDCDTALACLYQAEFLGIDEALRDDVSNEILECLERLGRNVDLRRELRARTNADDTPPPDPDETVLASFDDKAVTLDDYERAVEELSDAERDRLATPEQREAFLRRLVAERLFEETKRARRLTLHPERLESAP